MKIIDLDYNPLRRSISTQNAATRASYLPQSLESARVNLDINKRLMDLQDENRAADRQARLVNSIAGLANVGLNVAESIGKIIDQKQLQEAKPMAYQASNEIKAAMREARLNGEFTIEKDPTTGKYVIPETPQRVTEVMNKWKEAGKEKKFWSSAKGFLDDSLNQSFYSAVGVATDEAIIQGARDRDAAFMQNVSLATQESISTGSMDPVGAQIQSADWLTDDAKAVLMEQARKDVLFGRTSNELTAIASKDSAQAALTAFESVKGNFGEDDQKRLRAAMAQADKDAYNLSLSTAVEQYTTLTAPETDELGNQVKPGVVRADAIRGIEQTWKGRKADKDAVVAELRKMQDIAEWDYSYSLYNDSRDDLEALKKGYEDIKTGADSYRFEGIDETQKRILDMFERRINELTPRDLGPDWDFAYNLYNDSRDDLNALKKGYESIKSGEYSPRFDGNDETRKKFLDMFERRIDELTPKEGGSGGGSEGLAQEAAKLMLAYKEKRPGMDGNPVRWDVVRAGLIDILDRGGPASTIMNYLADGDSGGRPEYYPTLQGYTETMTEMMKKATPIEKGRMKRQLEETLSAFGSMIGKGMTVSDLKKSADMALAIEFAKEFDRLKNTIDFGVKDTLFDRGGEQQMAEYVYAAQQGKLDELVFVDTATGTRRFTRTDTGMKQIMQIQRDKFRDMGINITTSDFAKQGKDDVGASFIHKDSAGNTYTFRSDDGKTAYPVKQTSNGWERIQQPTPKPADDPVLTQLEETKTADTKIKNENIQMILSIPDQRKRKDRVQAFLDAGVLTLRDLEEAGLDRNGNPKPTPARGGAR